MKLRMGRFLTLITLFVLSGCGTLGSGCRSGDTEETNGYPPQGVSDESAPIVVNEPGTGDETSGVETVTSAESSQLPTPIIFEPPAGPNYAAGSIVVHTVAKGEWLYQIARCYGTSFHELYMANRYIRHPNLIWPGMKVTVPNIGSVGAVVGPPCVQLYTVQPGDTWYALGRMFHIDPRILWKANPGPLWAGKRIYVPSMTPVNVAPPSLSQSLVFNLDGDLAVWRKADATVAVYEDTTAHILDMATNENGRFILIKQTRDLGQSVEIALVDRTNLDVTVVETGLPPEQTGSSEQFRPTMLVSPNGAWAAYLVREGETVRLTAFATNNPGDLQQRSGITHGNMAVGGPQLFAGGADDYFLMLDDTGIYEYPYVLDGRERQIAILDPNDSAAPDFLEAVAWSPVGKYLLMQGYFAGTTSHFVLDKDTGFWAELPDSVGAAMRADAFWLQDGTAAVLTPPYDNALGPKFAVYQPESTATALELAEISADTLTVYGSRRAAPGYSISAPGVQPRSEMFDFTIVGGGAASGYWTVAVGSTMAGRLNQVPAAAYRHHWTWNGSGVLIEQSDVSRIWDLVYVPDNGNVGFSLANWLGVKISHFSWVVD